MTVVAVQIDPPLAALFANLPAAEPTEDLEARREAANSTFLLLAADEPGTTASTHDCPVDGGTIRIRVRRPDGHATLPGLYFVHGGGWFQGNLDTAEVENGPMASLAQCVVVSVEYRLAPEHPFPVPFEDVMAGWAWLHEHADEHGIDTTRVAVAGTSAGGNLAAALCLATRDRGLPQPIVQLLDVPATDLTLGSPSITEVGNAAGLTEADVKQFADWYAGDQLTHPYVSPLLAPDLSGIAPAVVLTAQHDPVRDDGERWVSALQAAGVQASCLRVLNHLHGTWVIPITITAGLVRDLRATVLRRAFAGTLLP